MSQPLPIPLAAEFVYGIEENGHIPTGIDGGADPAITKEWIEQVIESRVQPRIEGLLITPIDLESGTRDKGHLTPRYHT